MNCGLYRNGLIELARGAKADARLSVHLESCGECREFLALQRRLSIAVRGVAASAASVSLPRGLESELLAEFDAVRGVSRRPKTFWFTASAFALTAAAMVAVVLLRTQNPVAREEPKVIASVVAPAPVMAPAVGGLRPVTVPPGKPVRTRVAPKKQAEPEVQEAAFVSIPYTMPLGPGERADVVRMDVPVAQLIAAGLPMRVHDMGGSASADVLVGEDGRARAVRLISVADTNSNRSFR